MAAYLYQSGVWIIKELSWKDDVKIIEFSTVGRTTLFNSGTGSIFVQNISAETDGISHSSAFSVGKEIKPGEYFSEEHLPPFPIGTFSLNHVLTVAEMQKTRAVIVYFDKDHPKLAMFKSFHERVKEPLFVLPAKYTVNYYSNKQGKRLSKTVGCDAIYMRPNK